MYYELQKSILAVVEIILICQFVKKNKYRKQIFAIVFILYLAAVLYFTLFRGSRGGLGRIQFKIRMPFYRALKRGRYGSVANRSLLNMILFVPYGYLVCYYFNLKKALEKINCICIMIIGFMASLAIEISQFVFKRGVFELDDLIKNTMGAVMGWTIFVILNRRNNSH